MMIQKLHLDLLEPQNSKLTLGATALTLASSMGRDMAAAITSITNDVTAFRKVVADKIQATNVRVDTLQAEQADLETLVATKADISRLEAAEASIGELIAADAEIERLVAEKAGIADLNATNATVQDLTAAQANIKSLLSGNAGIGDLQAIHLTGDNIVIEDATIAQAVMTNLGRLIAGYLSPVIAKINEAITWLNSLDDAQKNQIIRIAAIIAAIGPMLVIIGTVIAKVGVIMQAVEKLGKSMILLKTNIANGTGVVGKLTTAISGLSAPVIAIVAVIGVLIAAFVHLWRTNDEFREKVTAVWNRVKSIFANFAQGVADRLAYDKAASFYFGEYAKLNFEEVANI